MDVQIKICMTIIDFWNTAFSIREYKYAIWVADNKTLTAALKSCNDSITSEIKKILGPLDAVTNADIKAELVLVHAAVSK